MWRIPPSKTPIDNKIDIPYCVAMSLLWPTGKPITVLTTEHGKPLQLTFDGELHTVDFVCNRWRDGGAWWSGESDREYIKWRLSRGFYA